MLNQRLQQKLVQKLSPQQIQMIKLLEIPTMQLEERIKEELEENPALEEGREKTEDNSDDASSQAEDNSDNTDLSIDEYLSSDDTPLYKLNAKNFSQEEQKNEIPFSVGNSFHDQLESQLGLRNIDGRQKALAEYLIGNIDDDGYLRRDISAIVDDLAFSLGIETSEEELEKVLHLIQEFDPPGVGARDLRECLMLQLQQKEEGPDIILAKKILIQHFDEFTKKHYDKIMSRLGVSENELKNAISEILKLNPKPGGSFQSDRVAEHIIPDFILENKDGTLQLSLNSRNIPELRVSRTYTDMLDSYSKNKSDKQTKDAVSFVKQKLDSAKWFIEAIRQRQNTLMHTMEAIVDYQRNYFLSGGDEALLNPMILKDIADTTGFDISTVSRVANSKYVQTPFGIFPLKFFFSEGLQTDSGEEVSTREIKKILQECVENESKRKPLTDDELAAILQEKGYQIARRTVAKYREQLNIPVARLRKQL
ncbi:MAG: RNA polymerase factor sigma-54 [Bacteroidales bacterium]|jgi:RNA polymerase sigma-54 factor|nr:RNA polymerase factor sigma-54 [Bacteroidales bacterium]